MVQVLLLISTSFFAVALLLNAKRFMTNIKRVKGLSFMLCAAWVLMFVGLGVFFARNNMVEGVGSLDKAASFQFLCYGLAGCIIVMYLLGHKVSSGMGFALKALAVYCMFGIISAAYSPIPIISFYKASVLLMMVFLFAACVSVFSRKGDGKWPLEICYFIVGLFCFGALAGALIWPEQGLQRATGSVGVLLYGTFPIMNANELGSFGFFAFTIGLRRSFEKQKFTIKLYYISLCLVGFTVLFLAQSRTALIGAILGVLIMAVGIKKMRKLAFVLLIFMFMGVGYLAIKSNFDLAGGVANSALEYAQRGQKEGGMQSFNDRVDTWFNLGLGKLADAPFLGHGFDVGVAYDISGKHGKSHMHNSHFQILANNGILGYIPWALFFISVCWYVFRHAKKRFLCKTDEDRYFLESAVVVLEIALRTMTGSVLVTHQWSLMIFFGIYIMFETTRRKNILAQRMAANESITIK